MNKIKINVLWTGGLDSSFRVIELSQMDVEIQPYYIVDTVRRSKKMEQMAIERITNIIRSHPRTKAILNDIILIDTKEIKSDSEITAAFNRLHDKYTIGHQYDLIARYAKQHNIRFEVGLEKSDRSKAYECITSETKFELVEDGMYRTLRIVPDLSSKDGVTVFENMDCPYSLWNLTKQEEVARLVELGHADTVKYTWFCHRPIFGMPCGHCNPCRDAINEGMEFRVPKLGKMMYYIYRPYEMISFRIKKIFD